MSISNKYKDILEDIIDSLDIKHPTILKKIDLLSNNIPNSKDNSSDPKMNDDFSDRLQEQQQCKITPLPLSWVLKAVMRR